VSIEELRTSKDLIMPRDHRGPLQNSAEISDSAFQIGGHILRSPESWGDADPQYRSIEAHH